MGINSGGINKSQTTVTELTVVNRATINSTTLVVGDGAVTVGVDDAGHDVKFFGDTASAYMLWDTSDDDLILGGAAGLVVPDGQLVLASTAVSSTAAELNVLDGLNRGHIIVGNASGVPTSLGEGSEDQVLTIDSNGDAVWAAASSGGASNLNGLSDVSYSSGNLIITSLDFLTTSATAHNAAGTDIKISAGATTAGTTNNIAGGTLTIEGGQGKGTGVGGDIEFRVAKAAGGSASSLNAVATVMKIKQNKSLDIQGPIVVGADDSGHDITFHGDTASAYMMWDTSEDDLILGGAARMVIPDGQLVLASTAVGATAAEINAACDNSVGGDHDDAAVVVADDFFMFRDGSVTGATKFDSISDLIGLVASTGLTASSGTIVNNCVLNTVTTATAVTIATTDNGRTYLIKELGGNQTFTLPAPTANFKVEFLCVMNNLDYTIQIKTAHIDHRIAAGLFIREDQGADTEHGWDNSPASYVGVSTATFIGGASEQLRNNVTLDNPLAGSKWEFYSDGTYWYCRGELVMTASTSYTGTITFDRDT